MKNAFLMILSTLLLVGCAGQRSYEHVSEEYNSVEALVQEEFPKPRFLHFIPNGVNPFHRNRIRAPYASLRQYCTAADMGEFQRLESKVIRYGNDEINDLFGVFGCYTGQGLKWVAEIDIQHNDYQESFIAVKTIPASRYLGAKEIVNAMKQQELRIVNNARARFESLAAEAKAPGQRVCTSDNHFGFVDRVSGDNIKVNVLGRAIRMKTYGFFYNEDIDFIHRPLNEDRWFSSKTWAACRFSDPV